jgi:hypothetical protein
MFRTPLIIVLFCLLFGPLAAQEGPSWAETTISGPWELPVGITFDESGQGYIWDMVGEVFVLDSSGQVISEPLLDIREEVSKWLDQGMVGFALDPNFQGNGYFYVLYPVDWHHYESYGTAAYNPRTTRTHAATFGRITRYTADPATGFRSIVPGSRHIVLGHGPADGLPILFDSHGLGTLAFGNDGSLLVSCGDGANSVWADVGSNGGSYYAEGLSLGIIQSGENVGAFRAQQKESLAGKILRIDPETGAGEPGNPFFDPENPEAKASKVYALGMRNPFRFVVHPETGSHTVADGRPGWILAGDVGDYTWEELNLFTRGGQNAGWPLYEGLERSPTYMSERVPNPFTPAIGCSEPNYLFRDLLAEDARDPSPPADPCQPGQTLPEGITSYMHHRPLLTYQNQDDKGLTQPRVWIPDYDQAGKATIRQMDSTLQGMPFQGDASIPAFYYGQGALPEKWHDHFFQVDYRGWIRVYQLDDEQQVKHSEPIYEREGERIVAAAPVPGEAALYYLSLSSRRLHKLTYGGRRRPNARLEVNHLFGESPLDLTLNATRSEAYDSPVTYEWRIDRDTLVGESMRNIRLTAREKAVIPVELVVRDTFGGRDSVFQEIFLNNAPPIVDWTSPVADARYPLAGTNLLRLEARATDAGSPNNDLLYHWQVYLHHNSHFHPSSEAEGTVTYALLSPLGCGSEEYWYRIVLTVTDPQGLAAEETRWVYPNCDFASLGDFEAMAFAKNQTIDLTWRVDYPGMVSHYEVERSQDFFHFESLGTTELSFFQDAPAIPGTYIYRIKAIGEEGAFWYSNLITRDLPNEGSHLVYPNPVVDELTLQIENMRTTSFEFRLFDRAGRFIRKEQQATFPEGESKYLFDVSDLAPGVYVYQIEDGPRLLVGKLVKR